jgi:hypothetical protein
MARYIFITGGVVSSLGKGLASAAFGRASPGARQFIGLQFHPELKSKPFEPHALFASFIAAGRGAKPASVGPGGPMAAVRIEDRYEKGWPSGLEEWSRNTAYGLTARPKRISLTLAIPHKFTYSLHSY